jgi:hypothetical protein
MGQYPGIMYPCLGLVDLSENNGSVIGDNGSISRDNPYPGIMDPFPEITYSGLGIMDPFPGIIESDLRQSFGWILTFHLFYFTS